MKIKITLLIFFYVFPFVPKVFSDDNLNNELNVNSFMQYLKKFKNEIELSNNDVFL